MTTNPTPSLGLSSKEAPSKGLPSQAALADTPRTDEKVYMMDGIEPVVPADFARTLERELADAREHIAQLNESLEAYREDWIDENI